MQAGDTLSHRSAEERAFRCAQHAGCAVLVAGGIGVTPLDQHGRSRRAEEAPSAHALRRPQPRADGLPARAAERCSATTCACTPTPRLARRWTSTRLLDACAADDQPLRLRPQAHARRRCWRSTQARGWTRERVHFETLHRARRGNAGDQPFEVELAPSGRSASPCRPTRSILDCLIEHGCDPMFDCKRGECGVCATPVIEGEIDHRDYVLSRTREGAGQRDADLHLALQGRSGWCSTSEAGSHETMHHTIPRQPRCRRVPWCATTDVHQRPVHQPGTVRARAGALLRQHLELRRPREPAAEARRLRSRTEIAGRPLIVVRHTDGSVRVLMNRCAHKGSRLRQRACGNTGKFFRCPYHAWTFKTDGIAAGDPAEERLRGHAARTSAKRGKGLTTVKHVRSYRGFVFVQDSTTRARTSRSYFGDSLSVDRQHGRPLARRRARDRRRRACASCTSATGRCSSRT